MTNDELRDELADLEHSGAPTVVMAAATVLYMAGWTRLDFSLLIMAIGRGTIAMMDSEEPAKPTLN